MVTKYQWDPLDEKEFEKQKEKLLMGMPFMTMLLHGHIRSPVEITTPEGRNLIPRVVNTHIEVYPITLDVVMDSSRSRVYNIEHDIRANNVVSSGVDLFLHRAAECGNKVGVKDGIRKNRESLRHKDTEGNLPLHLAVANGHKEVAFKLVKEYPQGSCALNNSKVSPLYNAVHLKYLDWAKYMFSKLAADESANVVLVRLTEGNSIVRAAITNRDQEMLRIILKSQRDLVKCTDEKGLTPLSYAAYEGFEDIVKYIIRKFPESISSYENDDGSYPIHKACLGGHVQVLQMLLSKSLQSETRLGRTVLHLAAEKERNQLKHVVSYLLNLNEGRELINKVDEYGSTPLDLAITNNNTEVEQLIRRCMPY